MVVSGVDNQRFENEVLTAGADYYFLKPFDVSMMAERILLMAGDTQSQGKSNAQAHFKNSYITLIIVSVSSSMTAS